MLLVAGAALLAAESAVVTKRRGSLLKADTIVRCRSGHLFSTLWIPGASVKSLRLGWWRVQYCPVGRHWSLVTPVAVRDLTESQRAAAASIHDLRVP